MPVTWLWGSEDRSSAAPTAARVLDIFTGLARHHLTDQHGRHIQTFQPQLSELQALVLDLLDIPLTVDCRSWLRVERLPAYAPELNPVEDLWGNVKGTELANRCPDTIDEAMQSACNGLERVGNDTDLCFALLHHARLSL